MAEFVLNVQDIDEAGKEYDFPVTPAWLARALEDTDVDPSEDAGEGRLVMHAHRQGSDIVLHGHVTAGLVVECARCLGEAPVDVSVDVASLLTARSTELRPEPDEVDLTPEDLERDFYSGDEIVLDDVVRENLLLEVPIKPLCAEDCPGIPVPADVAGPSDIRATEDGVDPRLAPLKELVGKLAPTEE